MESAPKPTLASGPNRRWLGGVYLSTAASISSLVALPFSDLGEPLLMLLAVFCLGPYLLILKRLLTADWTKGLALAMVSAPGAFLLVALVIPIVAPYPRDPQRLNISLLSLVLAQGLLLATAIKTYLSLGRGDRGRLLVSILLPPVYFTLVASFFWANASHFHKRQRMNAVDAVQTLGTLREALHIYKKECGGFPETLRRLAPPPSAEEPDCDHLDALRLAVEGKYLPNGFLAGQVDTLLRIIASGDSRGYHFVYWPNERASSSDTKQLLYESYEIRADPVTRSKTGFASYWLSQEGTIHENWWAPAGPSDPIHD